MSIRPLRDILVLRVLPQERTMALGLYLPELGDAALGTQLQCEVLAAGPGAHRFVRTPVPGRKLPRKYFIPTTAKAGDTVLVKSYDGTPAGDKVPNPENPDETLVLIRERDITGILVKEAA